MSHYTITPQPESIRDYRNLIDQIFSDMSNRKIGAAALALFEEKMSYSQISKVLKLKSKDAAASLISKHRKANNETN